jgi:hypothetical protein
LRADDGFRCREAGPARPDEDRGGLRDTDGPSVDGNSTCWMWLVLQAAPQARIERPELPK